MYIAPSAIKTPTKPDQCETQEGYRASHPGGCGPPGIHPQITYTTQRPWGGNEFDIRRGGGRKIGDGVEAIKRRLPGISPLPPSVW